MLTPVLLTSTIIKWLLPTNLLHVIFDEFYIFIDIQWIEKKIV